MPMGQVVRLIEINGAEESITRFRVPAAIIENDSNAGSNECGCGLKRCSDLDGRKRLVESSQRQLNRHCIDMVGGRIRPISIECSGDSLFRSNAIEFKVRQRGGKCCITVRS